MTPLDQEKELRCRERAMNAALATHESQAVRTAEETATTAERYFAFFAGNTMSADSTPMTVAFRTPSGLPDDWTGPAPLPAETLDSVMVKDVSLTELQEMRRRQLFELDTVANAIKAKGAVPC